MIRYFPVLATLAVLSLAQSTSACDPGPQFQAPRGYMLVPIQGYQQPRPMMFAQAGYGQQMIVSQPRAGYAMAGRGMAMASGGGVAVSVTNQRAILPRNRGTSVSIAGGGMATSMSSGRGGRAAAACAT